MKVCPWEKSCLLDWAWDIVYNSEYAVYRVDPKILAMMPKNTICWLQEEKEEVEYNYPI